MLWYQTIFVFFKHSLSSKTKVFVDLPWNNQQGPWDFSSRGLRHLPYSNSLLFGTIHFNWWHFIYSAFLIKFWELTLISLPLLYTYPMNLWIFLILLLKCHCYHHCFSLDPHHLWGQQKQLIFIVMKQCSFVLYVLS